MKTRPNARRCAHLAARLVIVALIATPALARGQDLRTDELPEQEPIPAGGGSAATTGLLTEPRLLASAINAGFDRFGETGTPSNGYYWELSNMITGSGWLSIGPGYRRQLFDKLAFVDVSAAVSWHAYNMMQGRFEFPDLARGHFRLGSQVMWQDQTQIDYWGVGSHSLESNRSQYRVQTIDSIGYATLFPKPSLSITGQVGFLRRPDVLSPSGTFKPSLPTTVEQFPLDPGVADAFQPNYMHNSVSVTSDTRDHRSRPTIGGLYRAALTTYVDQSTNTGTFTFRQYEAEGAQFVPVMHDRDWVLALHGWLVWDDVPGGHQVPFYLLPSLGGQDSLRSYPDYRFHDRNLALINAESRWALFTHVDAALFLDAGNVAPRVRDLNFDKTSIGAGIRVHTDRVTFGRLDVAHGGEGWQVVFRTNDPLRFSRLTRRVASVPFVP